MPSCAQRRAIPRPIPLAAPVTTATRFRNSRIWLPFFFLLPRLGDCFPADTFDALCTDRTDERALTVPMVGNDDGDDKKPQCRTQCDETYQARRSFLPL